MKSIINKLGIIPGEYDLYYDDEDCDTFILDDEIMGRLIAAAPEMLEALLSAYITYEVQKEIFESASIEGAYVTGSWSSTPKAIKSIIEKITGKTWDEISKIISHFS